jgi:hypothetical protein
MSHPPSHEAGPVIRFGRDRTPFLAVAGVAGALGLVLALLGWLSLPGGLLDWLLAIAGTLLVLAAVGFVLVLRQGGQGRRCSAEGIAVRGHVLGWDEVERLSVHTGQGGRQLLAAWPSAAGRRRLRDFGVRGSDEGPLWLGDLSRASQPAAEVRRALEAWTGRSIET